MLTITRSAILSTSSPFKFFNSSVVVCHVDQYTFWCYGGGLCLLACWCAHEYLYSDNRQAVSVLSRAPLPGREDSRITNASLGALNAFLLANGLDVAGGVPALHKAVRPLLRRCWRGARARDPRLRDCLVTYMSIQASFICL